MQDNPHPSHHGNLLVNQLQALWHSPDRLRKALSVVLGTVTFLLGFRLRGLITLDWQRMYRPEDFQQLGDLWDFLGQLQTGISPIWSSLEILSQISLGTVAPFSRVLYPLLLTFLTVAPLWIFPKTSRWILATAGISSLFFVVTAILHQGNPQLYDLYFPALVLGYLACLQKIQRGTSGWKLALLAGLLLAVLELTRTFALALFPVLLLAGLVALRQSPRRHWGAFLIPVLLLSGGWHLKQVVAHGHFHWTNNSGFNLHKVWADFAPPLPENQAPALYEGGFPNINTDAHSRLNQQVTREIREGIAQRPLDAATHAGHRLLGFFRPRTDLYLARLPAWLEWLYRPVIWGLGLLLLGLTLRIAVAVLRRPLSPTTWRVFFRPENMLVFAAAGASFLCAVGESGEEARFMISILPLLAALPGAAPKIWRQANP